MVLFNVSDIILTALLITMIITNSSEAGKTPSEEKSQQTAVEGKSSKGKNVESSASFNTDEGSTKMKGYGTFQEEEKEQIEQEKTAVEGKSSKGKYVESSASFNTDEEKNREAAQAEEIQRSGSFNSIKGYGTFQEDHTDYLREKKKMEDIELEKAEQFDILKY